MTAKILVQTSKLLTLELDSSRVQSYLPLCQLKWRKKNLWVKSIAEHAEYSFPALTRKQWIEDCLRNSWVKRVCLDRALGEPGIKLWAETCDRANKPIFLRIPSNSKLPDCRQAYSWRMKRIFDWWAALILLIIFSPVMLAVALVIELSTPGPIFFSQWRVGSRGKLFKIYKFRTMMVDAESQHHQLMVDGNSLHKLAADPRITPVGKWLRKYSLDELPQLFNVLRGEMSLVGPRPWALYDALRLNEADKARLNALPGMTGPWQVGTRSKLLDLNEVTKCDLNYLYSWSLLGDLKLLLLTVPKVISGSDAY